MFAFRGAPKSRRLFCVWSFFFLLTAGSGLPFSAVECSAQESAPTRAEKIRSGYTKFEYSVPMRDGTELFTIVYSPIDASEAKEYPILMVRTPYSIGPYGADQYRSRLGPNEMFEESGYIFAFQDVRGCYMSEGEFVNMRPHIDEKKGQEFDESSDTYDTIEWMMNNVPFNNGRVGQWGISYPGFYTAAGAIDSHPGLKCISPQAPIGDWFWDDMHRNGAFNVQLAVTFFSSFGKVRPEPTPSRSGRLDIGTNDSYQFFLDLGSLKNVNEQHFQRDIPFWNDVIEHPNYDYFWQSRNLIPHLKNVHCASLVVGGWFDTEDLYGPLRIYDSIEKNNPQIENTLVMGPWYHGGWNRSAGDSLGDASFDWPTAEWYRNEVEFPFFEHHLKDRAAPVLAEANVFETGANRWRRFEQWPPIDKLQPTDLLFQVDGGLTLCDEGDVSELTEEGADHYPSDPDKPVPYTTEISSRWSRDYMTEDQRFAARRPDVLVYRSEVLEQDVTLAGPLVADLWFSSTGTAADVVVKLVDEFPGRPFDGPEEGFQSGRQQLVRGQVMRTRFRDGFENPKPLIANEPAHVEFELHDVLHTFKRGHRIMIQVQSSWFPFVDRNPQTYVPNIFAADEEDFQLQTHSIHRSSSMPSRIRASVLKN
ncbi:MAG: CocE/NonD family hydrolase [Pirellulaceae bacterium]